MIQLLKNATKIALLVIAITCLSESFKFNMQNQQVCQSPKIIQFLFNYTIPTDDLRTLVNENISSLNIDDIKAKTVTFSSIKLTLNYVGGKTIKQVGPLQIEVSNQSFAGKLKWTAVVNKTIGHDTFNVSADIKPIAVKYIKAYVLEKKQYQIMNLTYTFTNDMIVNVTITPNESKKAAIEQVVKNELYNSINQKLKSLQSWLNDIASKQKIGQIFQSDKYQYRFYNWTLTIDTSAALVNYTNNNVLNGFKGDIVGDTSSICPTGVPRTQPGFRLFISMPFIQSLAKLTLQRYTPYKNVQINGSNIRTDFFQFRLADLEYVLSGVPQKYSQQYMKPVSFTCAISEIVSVYSKNNKMNLIVKWACNGYLWLDSATSFQIIDSEIQSNHQLSVMVGGSSLSVYNNVITILESTFKPVGEITVKNKDLAETIMSEFLNDLRTYIPGTYFKVPPNSQNIEIISETDFADGIWIG